MHHYKPSGKPIYFSVGGGGGGGKGTEGEPSLIVFLSTFSFQPVVRESSDSFVPTTGDDEVNIHSAARYSAFVWAVHKTDSVPKRLHAVLAPGNQRGDLNEKWESDGLHLMSRVRDGEPIYFCLPLSESDHLPLENYTLW